MVGSADFTWFQAARGRSGCTPPATGQVYRILPHTSGAKNRQYSFGRDPPTKLLPKLNIGRLDATPVSTPLLKQW
jgi:hypothetical protein